MNDMAGEPQAQNCFSYNSIKDVTVQAASRAARAYGCPSLGPVTPVSQGFRLPLDGDSLIRMRDKRSLSA